MLNVKIWDMYSTSHKEAQQDRVATSTSSSEQYKHMHRYTRWTRYYKDFWKKKKKNNAHTKTGWTYRSSVGQGQWHWIFHWEQTLQ